MRPSKVLILGLHKEVLQGPSLGRLPWSLQLPTMLLGPCKQGGPKGRLPYPSGFAPSPLSLRECLFAPFAKPLSLRAPFAKPPCQAPAALAASLLGCQAGCDAALGELHRIEMLSSCVLDHATRLRHLVTDSLHHATTTLTR
jgi:hypothetical protein